MKIKVLLLTLALSPLTFAADADVGKELYEDTEFSAKVNGEMRDDVTCSTCHSAADYTRADRNATDYKALHYWVDACNHRIDVGWFPEEVDDVTAYLNREYYKFPEE